MEKDLLKKIDIEKIADEGSKIYKKIKNKYDSEEKGKFLAIEIESENVFLGNSSAEALEKAKSAYPDKVFYVVRIGFDAAETIAKNILEGIY